MWITAGVVKAACAKNHDIRISDELPLISSLVSKVANKVSKPKKKCIHFRIVPKLHVTQRLMLNKSSARFYVFWPHKTKASDLYFF